MPVFPFLMGIFLIMLTKKRTRLGWNIDISTIEKHGISILKWCPALINATRKITPTKPKCYPDGPR